MALSNLFDRNFASAMRYNVTIQETLATSVQVDAGSALEAELAARKLYGDCHIVLSGDDYVDTQFAVQHQAPYYVSPNQDFTLIQGDCMEHLPQSDVLFDMVFADPPYFLSGGGISCQSGKVVCVDKGEWDKPLTPDEMDAFNLNWLSACRERMRENATIWVSGTHHNIFSVQHQLLKLGFKILNVVTWAKTNPPPNISCRYFTHSTEYLIWARKSAKVAHFFNYDLMKRLNGNKQMTDVWHLPAIGRWEKSCGKHPTQKPLSVLARIIQACTLPGAFILDPFSGSGTTGIAANMLDRSYVGIETEVEFLELSKARREEIEDVVIKNRYLEKTFKHANVTPQNNFNQMTK